MGQPPASRRIQRREQDLIISTQTSARFTLSQWFPTGEEIPPQGEIS